MTSGPMPRPGPDPNQPRPPGPGASRSNDLGPRALAAAGWALFGLVAIDYVGDGPLRSLDAPLLEALPHAGMLHTVSGWATSFGDPTVLVAMTLLGSAILLQRRAFIDASVLALATLTQIPLVYGIKRVFDRLRPSMGPEGAACCAFPSGHATGAAMVLLLLAVLLWHQRDRFRPWVEGVAVGLALVVGVTRLILAVHWPTDVLAGWGLGWGLAGVFLLLRAWLQRKKALAQLAPAEPVADRVDLGVSQGVYVHDEARIPAEIEDVAEDRPAVAAPVDLHAQEEGVPVEGFIAGQHRLPGLSSAS